jgi:hypothetical protein
MINKIKMMYLFTKSNVKFFFHLKVFTTTLIIILDKSGKGENKKGEKKKINKLI